MSQISFADAEYAGKRKKTRREVFLEEMEQVVPWKALLKIVEPHCPLVGRGRRPYPLDSMLRVHLMQNTVRPERSVHGGGALRDCIAAHVCGVESERADPGRDDHPQFRHLLEANDLAEDILEAVNSYLARKGLLLKRGSIGDATIIAAPSSTKNAEGQRDPEMHQTKKGNQWHFRMKAHIGVDADSGLLHTVIGSAANEVDVEHVADLLHGKEEQVWPIRATAAHPAVSSVKTCSEYPRASGHSHLSLERGSVGAAGLKAYDSVSAVRSDIADHLAWYNADRAHSSLDRCTPDEAYFAGLPQMKAAA